MQEKYEITDAELEIMQILWEEKECTLNNIIEKLSKISSLFRFKLRKKSQSRQ